MPKPTDRVHTYMEEFKDLREHRLWVGQERYGEFTFLIEDTFQNAFEELADLCNYAMFTFVKLRMLQERIKAEEREAYPLIEVPRGDTRQP